MDRRALDGVARHGGGAPTLTEQREAASARAPRRLEADPVVASVLARFPGAQIVAVRGRDGRPRQSPPLADAEMAMMTNRMPEDD